MHLLLGALLQLPAVLMYHQVDDRLPPDRLGRSLTIAPAQLRKQLDYFQMHHLRTVSVADYERAIKSHAPTANMVILTFDDGYEDQYTDAFPILLEYGAHATFFVTTGNVGRFNHVTWPQVRTMERSGMEIGGHNVDHVDLAGLTPAQQRSEVEGCLHALRVHAGVIATSYAYPGGTFNRETIVLLERERIAFAFTTDPSHRLGIEPRFEIPRIRVMPRTIVQLPEPPR